MLKEMVEVRRMHVVHIIKSLLLNLLFINSGLLLLLLINSLDRLKPSNLTISRTNCVFSIHKMRL